MSAAEQKAVRDELAAVCAGPAFARVPALAQLLTYLVEEDLQGRGSLLRETYIGSGFFGRPPDYDPKIDSVSPCECNPAAYTPRSTLCRDEPGPSHRHAQGLLCAVV